MNGNLLAEKEYKEMIDSGIKTWKWLKGLFGGEKLSDDDFIKVFLDEAKDKTSEIDLELPNNEFQKDFLNTAKIIENENIKENTIEPSQTISQTIENSQEKDLANNDSFVKDFQDTYAQTQKLSSSNNGIKAEKSQESQEMLETPEKDNFLPLNYFNLKAEYIEYDKQQGKAQSKASFINEFKEYAKREMTADEMRVLIALSHSKDSRLTQEHKTLIKDCLNLAQKHENPNLRFLSEGHLAIIRASNNQKLGTHSIKEFLSLANNPKDKLDSTIIKHCKEVCVKSIITNNKNLPQATIAKLTALINPTIAKTMEIGTSFKKELGM